MVAEDVGAQRLFRNLTFGRDIDLDSHLDGDPRGALQKVTDLLLRTAHRFRQFELAPLEANGFFDEVTEGAHEQAN